MSIDEYIIEYCALLQLFKNIKKRTLYKHVNAYTTLITSHDQIKHD